MDPFYTSMDPFYTSMDPFYTSMDPFYTSNSKISNSILIKYTRINFCQQFGSTCRKMRENSLQF
jgi:hypothetical protein